MLRIVTADLMFRLSQQLFSWPSLKLFAFTLLDLVVTDVFFLADFWYFGISDIHSSWKLSKASPLIHQRKAAGQEAPQASLEGSKSRLEAPKSKPGGTKIKA